MQSFRADLALLGLAVVGVLADLACVLTGHQAPALFEQVALAGLTGAAGVALPRSTSDSTAVPAPTVPAPAATYQAVPVAQVPQSAIAAGAGQAVYTGPVGQ